MNIDIYEPCPCLSGKKLKFCCLEILDEMMKVMRLSQSNQTRLALKALNSLDEKAPRNPWVATSRATIYIDERQYDAACECLEPVVREHPKHPIVLGLLANASFAAHGYEVSRPIIHRAFAFSTESLPGMMGSLAIGIAQVMLHHRKYLSARGHFALGLRSIPDERKQDAFRFLMNFDRNVSIPYVFRGVHHLVKLDGNEELRTKFQQATKLCELGAWSPAIGIFSQLAEANENNADAYYNLALCQAWDGEEFKAAESFRRAVALYGDYSRQVDCETLAQLLDAEADIEKEQILLLTYHLSSVSRFLTILDEQPCFKRADTEDEFEQDERPSAMYTILDREIGEENTVIERLEDLPTVLGEIFVIDSEISADEKSRALLFRLDFDSTEKCQEKFEAVVGEFAELKESDADSTFISLQLPREYFSLEKKHWFPASCSNVSQRRLLKNRITRFINDWPSSSRAALDGKTPREVAGDDAYSVKLAAAILVLEAFCDREKFSLDTKALADEYHVRLPDAPEIIDDASTQNFTSAEFVRIDPEKLDDKQLEKVLNRALLLWNNGSLESILKKAISRMDEVETLNKDLIYRSLSNLMRDQNRHEEAIEWTIKGLEYAQKQDDSFLSAVPWFIKLVVTRLDNPDDPELIPLLKRIESEYFVKLPELRGNLTELLQQFDMEPPWETTVVAAGVAGEAISEGGLWTPSQNETSDKSENKLWLPGQD